MKRGPCWLWLAVVFLLCILYSSVDGPHLHQQDRSLLGQSGFVSTGCQALGTAMPKLLRSRAGPWEFFAIKFRFLITDIAGDGPRWWEYRGPPSPNVDRSQDLVVSRKAAGQGWQPTDECFPAKFRHSGSQIQNLGFATAFS